MTRVADGIPRPSPPRWHSPDRYASDIPPRTVSLPETAVKRSAVRLVDPPFKVPGLEDVQGPRPPAGVVAGKVEVDGGDLGLDGTPQSPADVRHQSEQVETGELALDLSSILPPEIRLAQGGSEVLVELRLLSGVAEVEARVVVPAQLEIDYAQRGPVVDEVLAEQVVVAWHGRQRRGSDRALDPVHRGQPVPVAAGDRDL